MCWQLVFFLQEAMVVSACGNTGEEHKKGTARGKGKGTIYELWSSQWTSRPSIRGWWPVPKILQWWSSSLCRTHLFGLMYLDLLSNLGVLVAASWCHICLWMGSVSVTADSSALSACSRDICPILTTVQYACGGKAIFPPCRGSSGSF